MQEAPHAGCVDDHRRVDDFSRAVVAFVFDDDARDCSVAIAHDVARPRREQPRPATDGGVQQQLVEVGPADLPRLGRSADARRVAAVLGADDDVVLPVRAERGERPDRVHVARRDGARGAEVGPRAQQARVLRIAEVVRGRDAEKCVEVR